MLNHTRRKLIGCMTLLLSLTACTYNPFVPNQGTNQLTGSAAGAAVGAGVGVGTGLLFDLPNSAIAALGITGGALGYYVTTNRFASGGIIQAGGQVFSVGDYTTIEIPTDNLFESNSSEFLPGYEPTLKSVMDVLNRQPDNNVLISGNTSGFGTAKYQNRLSEERARVIAGYLWAHGMYNFRDYPRDTTVRKLSYVGYGNYFPIANDIKPESLRQNSRIQITSYPPQSDLAQDKRLKVFSNIGGLDDDGPSQMSATAPSMGTETAFKDETVFAPPPRVMAQNNTVLKEGPTPPTAMAANQSPSKSYDIVWKNHSKAESSPQTNTGDKVAKQGGAKVDTVG